MSDKVYCYPGTDVLINKFGIMDNEKLKAIESEITGAKFAQMLKSPIMGGYTLRHLQAIHKRLFEEIYPFAGKIREVAIAKSQLFCLPQYINTAAQDIFGKLQKDNYLRGLNKEAFIAKLAYYFGDINALHPFREGNGRTQRLFLIQLSKDAGYNLDILNVDKSALLEADIAAMRELTCRRQSDSIFKA